MKNQAQGGLSAIDHLLMRSQWIGRANILGMTNVEEWHDRKDESKNQREAVLTTSPDTIGLSKKHEPHNKENR
jgi:hypothetical protein